MLNIANNPIIQQLQKFDKCGHSYVEKDTLVKTCCLFPQSLDEYLVFEEDLETLVAEGVLHLEGNHVFLHDTWDDETFAAHKLADFLQSSPQTAQPLPEELLVGSIMLNKEQRQAVTMVCENNLSVITGCAGTGRAQQPARWSMC